MIRLLIDGVAFQPDRPAALPFWRPLIEALAQRIGLEVLLLDRGGAPAIERVTMLPFPAYLTQDCAADSLLIQRMCDLYRVDVFGSTGWTSPVATPAVMILSDPRDWLEHASDRHALERETALAFAYHHLCTSEQANAYLRALLPDLPPEAVTRVEPAAEKISGQMVKAIERLHCESRQGRYATFFEEWRRLREVQASVDYSCATV